MDLRESMLAAADDAPLETSTVDLNEIVRAERRAWATRHVGMCSVALAAAVAAALTVPALAGGRNAGTSDAGTQAAIGPPPAATSAAASASPSGTTRLRLTAADVSGMLGGGSGGRGGSTGGFWLIAYRDLNVHLAADGNPCTLAPGATAGKGRAPAPEDTCTKVERAGRTVWVRRWGYSPDLRPWMSPETTVVEVFVRKGDRAMMLGITNTYPMKGSKPSPSPGGSFDISDEELAKFALTVDFPSD